MDVTASMDDPPLSFVDRPYIRHLHLFNRLPASSAAFFVQRPQS
jgi:hypothetical protein